MAEKKQMDMSKAIADGLMAISTQLKYLGTGDAASTMGAIEFHGKCVKEAGEAIAAAIGDLAEAIRDGKK